MDRLYRFRIGIVMALVILVGSIFSLRLFSLQLGGKEETAYDTATTTTYTQTVSAARGYVLDRHGTILIRNRATYSVTLNPVLLRNADDPNGLLLKLAQACRKYGIAYEDTLPISTTTPFTYVEDGRDYVFRKFLLGREWDYDMTAENLVKKLRSVYRISDEYTDAEARIIMGLQYELDLPIYAYTDNYTLTEDISADNLAILKELGIPGLTVNTSTVREYNTSFAAQLLGHVGSIDAEQVDEYLAKGYAMDAKIGQDGLEAGFEEYLHGTDGVKEITAAADGTILEEHWEVEPKSGANVITSLDIGLQEVAEKSLATHIQAIADQNAEKQTDGYDASAGAAVVIDVNTGEVLCAANYPTYDPQDYYTKYDELIGEKVTPLRDRALMNAYPPGSTFKMITSVAAMRAGISDGYQVNGTGYYEFEDGTILGCWIAKSGGSHGVLNMEGALAQSCNIYFYTVGMMTGIDGIDQVAASFGIGEDSGCEVPNADGQMASPEVKAALFPDSSTNGWYYADTATAAIGQSYTEVTPLQLCRYVATIANGGTLYKASMLHRAVSSDYQTLVAANDHTPVATEVISKKERSVLYEGMRLCVTEGTGKGLSDYDLEVCAKTGTASHGTGGSDHGAFVCFAPADDPQIAIAVYVEHGASGGNFSGVAADIMDYYFNSQYPSQEIQLEDQMTED